MSNKLSKITAWLVASISLVSFILSYTALRSVAAEYGFDGWLSYLWPLLIDFALVVVSLAVVRAYLNRESTLWPWFLVAVFTTATIVFNLVHAGKFEIIRYSVAVVPPVVLFLSFESLMGMVRGGIKKSELGEALDILETTIIKKQTRADNLTGTLDSLQRQIEAKEQELKDRDKVVMVLSQTPPEEMTPDERLPFVVQGVQMGLSDETLAETFGKTIKTIQRDRGRANGQLTRDKITSP